jgi:ActR/RegA family two-component response regulator
VKIENQTQQGGHSDAPEAENTPAKRLSWIRTQLIEDGCELTTSEMAKKWSCCTKTIRRDLEEFKGQIKKVGKDTWKKK